MKLRYWIGMVATLVACSAWAAAETQYAVPNEVKQKIEGVVAKTGAKVNYFPGPGGTIGVGLTMANGRQMIVYATADGAALFSGAAIDTATGENVTRRDLEARMPAPDYSKLKAVLAKANAIRAGAAKPTTDFYVFVDPFCPYCHKTFEAFEQLGRESTTFRVHWIPVGILGPKSENAAKGLLGLPEGKQAAAFASVMTSSVSAASPEEIAAGNKPHDLNLAAFRNFQFSAVPVVVTVRGDSVDVTQGMPQIADLRSAVAPAKVAAR